MNMQKLHQEFSQNARCYCPATKSHEIERIIRIILSICCKENKKLDTAYEHEDTVNSGLYNERHNTFMVINND